ncbi:MAG: OmpA family protein [Bacteroidota bacterium]
MAKKSGAAWGYAANVGPKVNTPYHDSNLALSADGSTLFIYKDDNGGDIYYCERQADGTWGEPVPLPGIINSSFEEKSITISKDEKTLYFTSNRPGGYGNTDLYKATKDSKGEWSNTKNLGPKINTEFDEDGPFLDYDGVTLYFSSKGHKGMGGHDIFKAIYDPQKNEWTDPENLGYPINTPDDDIYFISAPDGKRAYYSSVRDDGMGYTDIYMITIPDGLKNTTPVVASKDPEPIIETPKDTATVVVKEPVDPVVKDPVVKKDPVVEPKKELKPIKYIVTVVDAIDKSPLNAKVRLQGAKDNVIVKSTSTGSGVFEFEVTSKTAKDYRLSVELEDYVFQNQNVKIQGATTEDKTINRTIELRKLAKGVSSILHNLYFDFDKATFKTESYGELNKLEAMLRQNERLTVEIGGHTDAVGTKAYNLFLSRKRAEAVKDYLTKKGIDARRINAVGYGKTKPLASNDDESEGRELNRRVEFKVLQN